MYRSYIIFAGQIAVFFFIGTRKAGVEMDDGTHYMVFNGFWSGRDCRVTDFARSSDTVTPPFSAHQGRTHKTSRDFAMILCRNKPLGRAGMSKYHLIYSHPTEWES